MARDVAFRLKSYLLDLVTINALAEYQDQLEAWKLYLEDVVDAANTASKKVQDTLTEANMELAAARERSMAIAMFMLSMMAGPAIAWLGGMVKVNWAPKLTGSSTRIITQTRRVWETDVLGKEFVRLIPQTIETTVKAEVANGVAGDLSKGVANWLYGQFASAVKPTAKPTQGLAAADFSVLTFESMRTGMLRALYDTQNEVKSQLLEVANNIRNDSEFGEKLVAQVLKERPGLKNNEAAQEQAGMAIIANLLNDQRQKWASQDKWFYFANNPPHLKSDLSTIYERGVWAQWLQDQHVHADAELVGGSKYSWDVRVKVKSDSGYLMTNAVQSELRSMAMPSMFDMPGWDNKLLDAVVEIEDSDDTKLGDEITDEQKRKKAAIIETARKSVSDLLNWARNFNPVRPMDYGIPRTLTPIQNYSSRFTSYRSS